MPNRAQKKKEGKKNQTQKLWLRYWFDVALRYPSYNSYDVKSWFKCYHKIIRYVTLMMWEKD